MMTDLRIWRAGTRKDEAAAAGERRRPWWVWAAPAVVILVTLLARNSDLFTRRFYESEDYGADSILVEQARHFNLLIGNYSRDFFNHPGPAYLYVQAAGQTVLYNMLHLVPTAWNGQVIALYALDSLLVGLAVFVVYGWTGYRGALATTAVLLGFSVLHTGVLSAAWLPYQDVPAFALFLLAAGSVAAGRGRDAWIAALAGWLLIHRYAAMLLFVPLLTVVVLVLVVWPHRRRLRAALRDLMHAPSVWVPTVIVSALFALPIVLDLILHWPGQFGKYIAYDRSSKSGGHNLATIVHYVIWFWGPGTSAWVVIPALSLAAIGAALLTKAPLRRYLVALLILNAVTSVALFYYATNGIDEINEEYIGYFYWSVPMVAVLVIVIAVIAALPGLLTSRAVPAIAACAAVAAAAVFAVVPGTRTSTAYVDPEFEKGPGGATDPALPGVVRTVATDAHGATVVIYLEQPAWAAMTGFVAQAERTGVPVCLANPWWTFMVTSQFICTPSEVANGANFIFLPTGTPARHTVARLESAIIATYFPQPGHSS
ncbi:MAG: hypothetical protein ABSA93_06255 [Streptosporangiaceae bacterium]